MGQPRIFAKKAMFKMLEPGTYTWCACGSSANQPFCDGAHQGSEFKPQLIQIEEKQRVALCQCKQTAGPPHCDGTHNDV